jgi:hypothetical protein
MALYLTDHTGIGSESNAEREEREAVMAGMLDYPASACDAVKALDREEDAFYAAMAGAEADDRRYELMRGIY